MTTYTELVNQIRDYTETNTTNSAGAYNGVLTDTIVNDFINITITSTPSASGPGGGNVVFIGPTTVSA